jgi:fluoride exporter
MMTRQMIVQIAAVGLGGATGSIARWMLGTWIQRAAGSALPVGTITVNVSGCLMIGVLSAMIPPGRETFRLALLVGVLGGYTTFSSFGRETLTLAQEGRWAMAMANVLISNAAGLVAVWIGHRLGQAWA